MYTTVNVGVTSVIFVLADTEHIMVSVGVTFVICVLADDVCDGQ